ncbi:MAG: class B sortase [Lachnospiraceae bacterium]|nr:class B sortase [Lachnospiraceae bacterium]
MGSKRGIAVAIVAALLIVIALVFAIGYYAGRSRSAGQGNTTENTEPETEISTVDELLDTVTAAEPVSRPAQWYGAYESSGDIERDIDLAGFENRCSDVYAFIEIPGTGIEEPVAYCEDAVDPFWFSHDIDGNPSDKGMIITDSLNGKDFSDPVTLIYGKNPDDGTMFTGLAAFHDPDFFKTHDRVNIYLSEAELTYRIYACYIGSSDHIMKDYDFNDPAAFNKYYDSIADIRDLAMNIREDAKPQPGDHAIVLITHCGDESKRLFVHAVLDEVRWGK